MKECCLIVLLSPLTNKMPRSFIPLENADTHYQNPGSDPESVCNEFARLISHQDGLMF